MQVVVASLWLAAFAAIITISVGVAVWLAQARSMLRRSFLELSLFIGLWIMSNVIFAVVEGDTQFYIALLSYFFAMGVAIHLFLFAHRAAEKSTGVWPLVTAGYIVGLASAIPGVVAVSVVDGRIMTNLFALVCYGLALTFYIISAIVILLRARKKARYIQRKQLSVILLGAALASMAGLLCNLILPIFDEYRFVQIGTASASLFVAAVALAVVKHGLIDIRQAILRTVSYGLVVVAMATIYIALAYGLAAPLRIKSESVDPILVNVLVVLLLVFLFQPLRRFFDKATNSIFYRGGYSHDRLSNRLNEIITTETNLEELLGGVSKLLVKTLMPESVTFILRRDETEPLVVYSGADRGVSVSESEQLLEWWSGRNDLSQPMVIRRDLSLESVDEDIIKTIDKLGAEALFPLNYNHRSKGLLVLGERRSGRFSMTDISVLNSSINELAVAIQNALTLLEVKQLNKNLLQRVDNATKELRASNAELVKLDETKDEFISMASHQLRTPLTSIKGYLAMLLDGDAGELAETQKKFLNEAYISSERMVGLINDFLNVSRLQTGKFVIEKQLVDLKNLVKQEINGLKINADGRNLTFDVEIDESMPKLELDEAKMRQVIMNFADNALFYSSPGSVIKVQLLVDNDQVKFTVEDTGIGVPKNEQAKLFTKFFRATNARKQRPDGTGVGLFLAKRVVDGHGGEIIFSSKEGKGSTFGFNLPIKNLRSANDADNLDDNDN